MYYLGDIFIFCLFFFWKKKIDRTCIKVPKSEWPPMTFGGHPWSIRDKNYRKKRPNRKIFHSSLFVQSVVNWARVLLFAAYQLNNIDLSKNLYHIQMTSNWSRSHFFGSAAYPLNYIDLLKNISSCMSSK